MSSSNLVSSLWPHLSILTFNLVFRHMKEKKNGKNIGRFKIKFNEEA